MYFCLGVANPAATPNWRRHCACFPACSKRAQAKSFCALRKLALLRKREKQTQRARGRGRWCLAFTVVWGVLEPHIKLMSRRKTSATTSVCLLAPRGTFYRCMWRKGARNDGAPALSFVPSWAISLWISCAFYVCWLHVVHLVSLCIEGSDPIPTWKTTRMNEWSWRWRCSRP